MSYTNTNTNNFIISIEGNISSGKSTLLADLKNKYKNNPQIIFLKEPVDEWEDIKDENGINMLEKFYANTCKYAFSFQIMAYISRLSLLRKIYNENNNVIIITERSLYTDKYVFAKMLYDQKNIESVHYQIYLKWFDEFIHDFPINHVIYVKTDPDICFKRIKTRSRTGEDVIPLDYLKLCNEYHEQFLDPNINILNCDQLILDGNIDIFENPITFTVWFNSINSIISKKLNYKDLTK